MDTLTVSDLQSRISNHPDVGVAVTIQQAIRHAIETKNLNQDTELTRDKLEDIRQSIYTLNEPAQLDGQMAGLLMLMSAMTTRSGGDNVENALKYIEALQRGEDPAQSQNRYTS